MSPYNCSPSKKEVIIVTQKRKKDAGAEAEIMEEYFSLANSLQFAWFAF